MTDIGKVERLAKEAERLERKLARTEFITLLRLLNDMPTEAAEAAIRESVDKFQAAEAVANMVRESSLDMTKQVAEYLRDVSSYLSHVRP